MARIIGDAMKRASPLPEWLDRSLLVREGWPNWHDAMKNVHHPKSSEELHLLSLARVRLAYDEILANQLALEIMRRQTKKKKGRSLKASNIRSTP